MYKSILLPIDLGQESSWKKAAPTAVAMAEQHGAKVHVLTVIPDYGMPVVGSFFPEDFAKKALDSSEKSVVELAAKLIPENVLAGATAVQGTIYKEIIATANEQGCDLIILASHKPENRDYLLGPNAARVVRHANQSVFVVRE